MNCRYAREIINSVVDGEGHPLEAEAREHICACQDCREWQAGMDHVLDLLHSAEAPPTPDIAAMVRIRLPSAHPASVRSQAAWLSPRKALSWLGASWLIGAAIVAAAVLALWPSLNIDSLMHSFGIIKHLLLPLDAAVVVAKAAAQIAGQTALGLGRAVGLGPALMVSLVVDLAILAVVLLIWHRRHLAASACLI